MFMSSARAWSLAAGVSVPSPHSFRHSFAILTYEYAEDIFAVRLQLEHKDRKTTEGYTAQIQGEKAKRKAANSWNSTFNATAWISPGGYIYRPVSIFTLPYGGPSCRNAVGHTVEISQSRAWVSGSKAH